MYVLVKMHVELRGGGRKTNPHCCNGVHLVQKQVHLLSFHPQTIHFPTSIHFLFWSLRAELWRTQSFFLSILSAAVLGESSGQNGSPSVLRWSQQPRPSRRSRPIASRRSVVGDWWGRGLQGPGGVWASHVGEEIGVRAQLVNVVAVLLTVGQTAPDERLESRRNLLSDW